MVDDKMDNSPRIGQWALILGGSSGLGLATAKKLARHGYNICIVHRDRRTDLAELNRQLSDIRAIGIDVLSYNIDATRADKRAEVIAYLAEALGESGEVKTLVHSIARGTLKPMGEKGADTLSNDDFRVTIEAMALSLYDWVSEMLEAKLFAADSRVISFTSEGNTRAWKHYAAVSAAKVTLEAISRSIAVEFAQYGIRCNCIQAGVTDTKSLQMIQGSDHIKQYSLSRNPFGRLTTPADVANAVYLLCRPEASWINGAIIPVDGGERIV